jgi:hypothetical protein
MHILEVFIVSVYSVKLAHILGESFHFGHNAFVGWSLIVVAALTLLLVTLLVTSQRLKQAGTKWTVLALFLVTSVIQGGFLTANYVWKFRPPPTAPPTAIRARRPLPVGGQLAGCRRASDRRPDNSARCAS